MNVVVKSFSRYSGNTVLTAIIAIAANTIKSEDVIIVTDNIDNYGGLFSSCRNIDDLYNNQDMKKLSVYDNIKDIEDFCLKLAKGLYITDIKTPELMRNVARKSFSDHDNRLFLFDIGRLTDTVKFSYGHITKYFNVFIDSYTRKKELYQGLSAVSDIERLKTTLICNKVEYSQSNLKDVAYDLKINRNTIKMFPRIEHMRDWNTNNHIFNLVYRALNRVEGLQELRNPILNILKEIDVR